jgi:hypothetical protein
MKRVHTHYDNLKVARNAPQEVIRAAYKGLSQKYHPDRNPGNPDASRIMSLINTSYEVLSDPVKRKQHDEWIRQQEGTEPHSATEEAKTGPTQTQADINFQPPTAGSCDFASLPSSVKEQLVARTTGANKQQFAVRTDNVTWKYVWTAGLVFWFVYLFNDATDFKWGEESTLWLMAFTFGAAFFLSKNIDWIIRWHSTPLRCWLIVSPLYVIKTHLDRVWFWPIWSIKDIKATHNYRNGSYQGTSLDISFEGKRESFTITPESAYNSLLSTLKTFDTTFRTAIGQGNIDYILKYDDFIDCPRTSADTKRHAFDKRTIIVFLSTFLGSAILFGIAFALNAKQPYKPVSYSASSARSIPYTPVQPAARPTYVRPITAPNGEPWPNRASYVSGYKKLHTNGLSSVTVDNTRNNSDVFVKLVSLDGTKAYPVRVFFIPAHGQFTVSNVTAGNYDVRYRDLDSGGLARSESFRLQETPTYDGIQYSNLTMTLYKVRHGNMQTYGISENEF